MEKEKFEEFVHTPKPEGKEFPVKIATKLYEKEELESDLSVFSENGRKAAEKYLADEPMTPAEQSLFGAERNSWWHGKYGFPYDNKTARREVLRRKYAPAKEIAAVKDLQDQLFEAIAIKDETKIKELKTVYEEKYPDHLEGVVALFELVPFLKLQNRFKEKEISDKKERVKLYEELTQYQFLLTHFVEYNSKDKNFLNNFWEVMERLAKEAGYLKIMHALRRGVLSQVAAIKILKSLGKDPILSHPAEDSFNAIDLWVESEKSAVQVKGSSKNASLVELDAISFPGAEVTEGDEINHYNSWESWQIQKFQAKLSQYSKIRNKRIKGYLLVIPKHGMDFVTGEPGEEVIQFFKEKLSPESLSETK